MTITITFCSKFLYELTRGDGYNPSESVLSKWIKAIASKLKVSLQSSDYIRTTLIRRASYVKGKVKACTGSAKRQQYLQQEWELKIRKQDVDLLEMKDRVESLEEEVMELQHEVAHAAQDIKQLVMERNDLQEREEELTMSVSRLEKDKRRLLTKARELTATATPRRRGRCYKPEEEYSESHRRRLKKQRTESCTQSLSWLEDQGFIPVSVTVRNMLTGREEAIQLCDRELDELFGQCDDLDKDSLDTVNMMLFIKDWYNVSDGAYHELAKVCKEMPRQYRLRQRITELNSLWNIRPTPNNTNGVQQSLKDRLIVRIRHLIKSSGTHDSPFMREKLIRVKLSGDGTKIGKRLHVIAFTFTLLDEDQATSAAGNHILAVFKQSESYEFLKLALADIINEVEQLNEIEVEDVTFKVSYYLGGDWKFLAIVTGIDSASSDHACIWCKCKKDERSDIHREWSLSDRDKGARTTEENVQLSQRSRARKEYNVTNRPLFSTIPLTHVVIDNLHLFLRTSDVLIDLLIVELRRQDAIENVKKFSNPDLTKYGHLQRYQTFVSSLGIPGFEFYVGRSSKELKCRSLTGPEKLKVLRNININTLLPRLSTTLCQQIQHLWNELLSLNATISSPAADLSEECITQYKRRAREWGEKFVAVYQRKNVTPYIHAMINHVGEFMQIHGSIIPFTQQGLEKKNDIIIQKSPHSHQTALIDQLIKWHFQSYCRISISPRTQ